MDLKLFVVAFKKESSSSNKKPSYEGRGQYVGEVNPIGDLCTSGIKIPPEKL